MRGATKTEKARTQRNPNVNDVIAAFVTAIAKQTRPARITIHLLILDRCFLSITRMECGKEEMEDGQNLGRAQFTFIRLARLATKNIGNSAIPETFDTRCP